MNNSSIKIHYLDHSGFSIETDRYFLVFDYYRGQIKIPDKKSIYIFCSHSHGDHFNPLILEWQSKHPDINYILSSDISVNKRISNLHILSAYEELTIDGLRVKSYGSTDLGISFLVSFDGANIFHAGDLNWWYWWGESPEEIQNAEKWFKEEIARIRGERIDLAFFPVDPRLEHNYCVGADFFIEEMKPRILIPMHFWDGFEIVRQYASNKIASSTKVIALEPGTVLDLNL